MCREGIRDKNNDAADHFHHDEFRCISKEHKTVDTSRKALCLWRLPRGIYSARTTLHIHTYREYECRAPRLIMLGEDYSSGAPLVEAVAELRLDAVREVE